MGSCRHSTPFQAEVLALKDGLAALHTNHCMPVMVESDSSELVQLVHNGPNETHPLHQLITTCQQLHRSLRSSSTMYIPRCCNISADMLARLGHFLRINNDFCWLVDPPSSVLEEVRRDNVM